MKRILTAFCLVAFGAAAVQASTIVLTFEGLGDQESVLNYYDGGKGGNGSGPGTNYGITFGADSLAIISNSQGGSGNFDGNPSGKTVVFFLTGPGDVMNIAGGFTTGFSFYYSAISEGGTVQVFSGANGTGTLLANLTLPTTPSKIGVPPCNSTDQFCPFVPFGVTFTGTADSVIFSGTANEIAFDNITLGSSIPSISPEPSTFLLLGSGAAALGLIRLRKRKA